jgi:hypothetical protein
MDQENGYCGPDYYEQMRSSQTDEESLSNFTFDDKILKLSAIYDC